MWSLGTPDEGLWLQLVCSVVDQKFRQIGACREVLVGTGEGLIVEATRGESRWGIGLVPGDARIQCPSDFRGTHVRVGLIPQPLYTTRTANK
mmetsp:Transcript_179169/g.568502  ORF Transcript_179169/g.568502 Transcript_179169/m.568502 type:complete len:92 (+) Transcript_179169:196-471(+)